MALEDPLLHFTIIAFSLMFISTSCLTFFNFDKLLEPILLSKQEPQGSSTVLVRVIAFVFGLLVLTIVGIGIQRWASGHSTQGMIAYALALTVAAIPYAIQLIQFILETYFNVQPASMGHTSETQVAAVAQDTTEAST